MITIANSASLRAVAAAVVVVALTACAKSPADAVADNWDLLGSFCADCHNDDDLSGELSFARLSPADVAQHPEVWEEVVRKLRGDLMPPPGGPRPAPERVAAFVTALEDYLDETAAVGGYRPGRVAVHRLNRSEYATSVEQLLAVHVDVRAMLPADVAIDGFDNVAEALRVSPTHLEQYIVAARDISARAVGNPRSPTVRADYRSDRANETSHVEGLPLGTRGGIAVQHYFPADGEYIFNVNVASVPAADLRAYPHGWLEYRHRVILTVDDERVFEGELGGEEDLRAVDQEQISAVNAIKDRFRDIRVSVKAGYRAVVATFVARSRAESDYRLTAFVPGETIPDVPRLRSLEIVGPYDPSGIAEPTESRQRIFSCYPGREEEMLPCAEEILSRLARQAYRRPITEADVVPLLEFYRAGQARGGFEAGIQSGITAMLVSTKFLYRAEPSEPPQGLSPGEAYAIDDLELAWRLAFFLWSSGPDEELLSLAEQHKLSEPQTYEAQVRRLLADPKSKSLVTNFAFQWLGVRRLQAIDPDPKLYPYFNEDLRAAFEREMELFVGSILRDGNASVLELLTARYTYVNERLARHYGIASVRGDQFRRVELEDPNRFGLLGKGSVLMVTSYPDRTSPVLRGAWVMEHLLGTPPAPPPPNVETDLSTPAGEKPKTVRTRLEQHRENPSCKGCHGVIDPYGLALENFSATGQWRTFDRAAEEQIDATTVLPGGQPIAGPVELRSALLERPEQFVQTLTEKLLTYALGRSVEYYDMPAVRRIVDEAAADDYTFESIVMAVAKSRPFRMRSAPGAEETNEVVATSSPDAAIRGGN